QRLLVGRQVVDPGGDQSLERVRDALREIVAAALEQHPDRLLDEQRVALGLGQEILARLGGKAVLRQERPEKLLALVCTERVELDRCRAHPSSAPARAEVEQLGTGEADD